MQRLAPYLPQNHISSDDSILKQYIQETNKLKAAFSSIKDCINELAFGDDRSSNDIHINILMKWLKHIASFVPDLLEDIEVLKTSVAEIADAEPPMKITFSGPKDNYCYAKDAKCSIHYSHRLPDLKLVDKLVNFSKTEIVEGYGYTNSSGAYVQFTLKDIERPDFRKVEQITGKVHNLIETVNLFKGGDDKESATSASKPYPSEIETRSAITDLQKFIKDYRIKPDSVDFTYSTLLDEAMTCLGIARPEGSYLEKSFD